MRHIKDRIAWIDPRDWSEYYEQRGITPISSLEVRAKREAQLKERERVMELNMFLYGKW